VADLSNMPLLMVRADFAHNPNTQITTRTWSSLVGRAATASPTGVIMSTTMGRQYELDQVEAGTLTAPLDNVDEALNPANTASPYATGGNSLLPLRTVQVAACWPLTGNMLNPLTAAAWGLSADTASFTSTVGDWTAAGGAALTRVTTPVHDGVGAGRVAWGAGSGRSISAPLPPLRTGTTYMASVWVQTNVPVRLVVAGAPGALSGTSGAWERLTAAFIPLVDTDTTSSTITLSCPTSVGASVTVLDSAQLELGGTASAWSASGTVVYPIHTGYIERFPESWTHNGYRGWTALATTDALGILPAATMSDVMTEVLDASGATGYWPMWDASDSRLAVNTCPRNGQRLTSTAPYQPYQPFRFAELGDINRAGDLPKFGSVQGPGPDGFNAVSLTPPAATPTSAFWYMAMEVNAIEQVWYDWATETNNGIAFSFWFRTTTNTKSLMSAIGPGYAAWECGVGSTGRVYLRETENGTTWTYTVTDTGASNDGAWHHVVCVESGDGVNTVTASLYVDGTLSGTATRTGFAHGFWGLALVLGTRWRPGYESVTADYAWVAIYSASPTPDAVLAQYRAGLDGFAGDTTGVRCGRILDWYGWQGPRALDAGATTMGPAKGLAGTSVLAALQECSATEQGAVWSDGTGAIRFQGRDALYVQTSPRVTFGEQEVPYQGDVALSLDRQRIANTVTVTPRTGDAVTLSSATSVAQYFTQTKQVSTNHNLATDVTGMAQNLLNRYQQPALRAEEVTVVPSTDPTLFPAVLGLALGDRARVVRRTSAGTTVTLDGYVQRVSHKIGPASWSTQVQVSPGYPYAPWVMGSATYGVLGTTTRVVY